VPDFWLSGKFQALGELQFSRSGENVKDIIACGFDAERTFIFTDFSYVGR
jgi:tryptophanyl-tRNA synthetase